MIAGKGLNEIEQGMMAGTYSEEMLKGLLYPQYEGYRETIKIYRNRSKNIYNGFSPIVYQATIVGLESCYHQYSDKRLFEDDDRFKMSDVIFRRNEIKKFIDENFNKEEMSKDEMQTKITIICYLEHLRTLLFQGQIESMHYHELDRLESDTLMWGINPEDKYAVLVVKENYDLLKQKFEFRGSLNNLSIYSRIMLSYLLETKMIKSIVDEYYM